jgi:hypothetical protein
MNKRKILVISGALACLTGCSGDFITLFVLGCRYPGYNHLTDTWSSLGASASPVSGIVSLWWVILGILFLWFAVGFRSAFSPGNPFVRTATWLLILYGLGEGAGSGLFKADHVGDSLTVSAVIHNVFGGIGVFALLILPLVMQKIIPGKVSPGFHKLSRLVFIVGCFLLILFLSRYLHFENNFPARNNGLWQRLFVLDYYLYLIVIAVWMIRKKAGAF